MIVNLPFFHIFSTAFRIHGQRRRQRGERLQGEPGGLDGLSAFGHGGAHEENGGDHSDHLRSVVPPPLAVRSFGGFVESKN